VFTYPEFNSLLVVRQTQDFCGSNIPPERKKKVGLNSISELSKYEPFDWGWFPVKTASFLYSTTSLAFYVIDTWVKASRA